MFFNDFISWNGIIKLNTFLVKLHTAWIVMYSSLYKKVLSCVMVNILLVFPEIEASSNITKTFHSFD